MIRIGIAKAKNILSALVNRVAFGGERIILESRGNPKAALVSLQDMRQLEMASRPTRSQRLLALAEADRVRAALEGRRLTDSTKQLHRLREERARELSKR